MINVEDETVQAALPDHEPSDEFSIGDVVTLKHSLDPEAMYLITTPIKETPDGPMTGGIPIDQAGNGLGMDGSFLVDDIKEKIGARKTIEEVEEIYVDMFAVKYGDTIPTEDVIAMLKRQIGEEATEE